MEAAFRSISTRLLVVLTVLAVCAGLAFAQGGGSGELTGQVTDPTGAVVSGAEVKLTNTATSTARTTTTSTDGIYRFPALPVVGVYVLEVSPKGFKSVKVQNVVISVGTITSRDVKLEVGASTEQVTVEAGQQIIQTEDSSISQLIDRRVWENMPLEARNANDFINLVAGAVPEQIAGGTFRGAAVNGVRTGGGNYMVEGVDNNEQGQGGVAICGTVCGQGGANTSVSPDAIEEYRVLTHDFSAEYGKVGGFVTDTVLKSGTNKWHGSLFEYNRIQALAANDWFSNAAGLKDHLVRNQFGGTVGGPIFKDKTFFYAAFEDHRFRTSSPSSALSITKQFYDFVNSGQLATYVNSLPICTSVGGCPLLPTTLGPVFQSLIQKWPQAVPLVDSNEVCTPFDPTVGPTNCTSQDGWGFNGLGNNTALGNYPVPIYGQATLSQITPLDQYRFSVKLDHNFSATDRLSGSYLFEDVKTTSNFGGSDTTFGVPLDNPNRAQTAGITWTHTFSPTVLNQFKIGYVRRTANFIDPGSAGIPEFFSIDPSGVGLGASLGIPQFFTENLFQYKDDISVTKGKHSLKFGAEFRRTRNKSTFSNDAYGHFATWGAEGLVTDGLFTDAIDNAYYGNNSSGLGGWYYAGAAVVPSTGAVPDFYRGYRANEMAAYGQDDWRVNSRLTLNLGVRWEYFGPPRNYKSNIDSNVYFGDGITPYPCQVLVSGVPTVVPCTNPFQPVNDQAYAFEAGARFEVRNTSIWNKDLNNFGPRIGFAWDTTGNQKLVVRGGGGTYYDRIYNNIFENIRFNAPFYADEITGIGSGVSLGPLKNPGLLTVPFTSNAFFVDPAHFPNGLPKPVPRHMDQNMVAPFYYQFNLGVQYSLAKDYVIETNYVGTLGRKLLGIVNRNTFDGRSGAGFSSIRPNPIFNSDNARGNYYTSNYHALEVTLRKRFSHGLLLNANYTYSKALDELSDVFRARNAAVSATDVQNLKNDYGPADFDIRNRVVVSTSYELPIFHGNRWLGGWTTNAIVSWNTGAPIGLLDGSSDSNRDGTRIDRPEFIGPGGPTSAINSHRIVGGAYQYLNPSKFAQAVTCLTDPKANTHGGKWCNPNLSRGAIPGPMFANIDFGLSKSFKINERMAFRFDANFFDLLNHPNFQNPSAAGGGANFASGNFGQSTTTDGDTGGHRVTQLAIRFDF
ncbi:MAG TPA: TonB-dependent receptor [Terriglobales bacterium]|nr:TonB-dependent receptor [Terriglobales bacterium]